MPRFLSLHFALPPSDQKFDSRDGGDSPTSVPLLGAGKHGAGKNGSGCLSRSRGSLSLDGGEATRRPCIIVSLAEGDGAPALPYGTMTARDMLKQRSAAQLEASSSKRADCCSSLCGLPLRNTLLQHSQRKLGGLVLVLVLVHMALFVNLAIILGQVIPLYYSLSLFVPPLLPLVSPIIALMALALSDEYLMRIFSATNVLCLLNNLILLVAGCNAGFNDSTSNNTPIFAYKTQRADTHHQCCACALRFVGEAKTTLNLFLLPLTAVLVDLAIVPVSHMYTAHLAFIHDTVRSRKDALLSLAGASHNTSVASLDASNSGMAALFGRNSSASPKWSR